MIYLKGMVIDMMKSKLFNNLILILAAIIWGAAFVAQDIGLEYLGPYWLNALRMLLGGIILLPIYKILDKKKNFESKEEKKNYDQKGILAGVICGLFLFLASTFQNFGIIGSGAGKSGFITSLYIILVPIISLFLHKKIGFNVWISSIVAIVGMYFLCFNNQIEGFRISDLYLILCAVFFSFQIIFVEKYSPCVNVIKLSCIQTLVVGILSLIMALIFEPINFDSMYKAILPILYLGIFSSCIAYTFQIIGQKNTNATVASLLMSLESVFSLLFGLIILNERFSIFEIIGCILIFVAVVFSQIPIKKKDNTINDK